MCVCEVCVCEVCEVSEVSEMWRSGSVWHFGMASSIGDCVRAQAAERRRQTGGDQSRHQADTKQDTRQTERVRGRLARTSTEGRDDCSWQSFSVQECRKRRARAGRQSIRAEQRSRQFLYAAWGMAVAHGGNWMRANSGLARPNRIDDGSATGRTKN